MKVVKIGHPVLRAVSAPMEAAALQSGEASRFIKTLISVMTAESKLAVGFSAPQVGVSKQAFVYKTLEGENVGVLNPKILSTSGPLSVDFEGCLSIPHYRFLVPRPDSVEAEFTNVDGELKHVSLSGFEAKVFLHEYDHLNGTLITDRLVSNKHILHYKLLRELPQQSLIELMQTADSELGDSQYKLTLS